MAGVLFLFLVFIFILYFIVTPIVKYGQSVPFYKQKIDKMRAQKVMEEATDWQEMNLARGFPRMGITVDMANVKKNSTEWHYGDIYAGKWYDEFDFTLDGNEGLYEHHNKMASIDPSFVPWPKGVPFTLKEEYDVAKIDFFELYNPNVKDLPFVMKFVNKKRNRVHESWKKKKVDYSNWIK